MAKATGNPFFHAMYEYAAAKPLTKEDHPWGETVFKVGGKVFVFLGTPEHAGVGLKAAPEELDSLLSLPFVKRSPYIGRYGWVRVTVENEDALDVALRLIDQSYDLIAAKAKSTRSGRKRKRKSK